jgi:hypothetical protein
MIFVLEAPHYYKNWSLQNGRHARRIVASDAAADSR